jgi:hypothetical protein
VLRDRRIRLLLITGAILLAGVLAGQTAVPHYLSPITCVAVAVVVQALRHLRVWTFRTRPSGAFLVRAIPVICGLAVVLRLGVSALNLPLPIFAHPYSWCCVPPGNLPRAQLLKHLNEQAGGQLVIVRYGPNHDFHVEWVYNEADLDQAKVVWAREMGQEENKRLLAYFRDRRALLLEPDEQPPRLTLYPAP